MKPQYQTRVQGSVITLLEVVTKVLASSVRRTVVSQHSSNSNPERLVVIFSRDKRNSTLLTLRQKRQKNNVTIQTRNISCTRNHRTPTRNILALRILPQNYQIRTRIQRHWGRTQQSKDAHQQQLTRTRHWGRTQWSQDATSQQLTWTQTSRRTTWRTKQTRTRTSRTTPRRTNRSKEKPFWPKQIRTWYKWRHISLVFSKRLESLRTTSRTIQSFPYSLVSN